MMTPKEIHWRIPFFETASSGWNFKQESNPLKSLTDLGRKLCEMKTIPPIKEEDNPAEASQSFEDSVDEQLVEKLRGIIWDARNNENINKNTKVLTALKKIDELIWWADLKVLSFRNKVFGFVYPCDRCAIETSPGFNLFE